jgi:hypothetical protein
LRGLELVPSEQRYRVPPTRTPSGHNASRWAAAKKRNVSVIRSFGV